MQRRVVEEPVSYTRTVRIVEEDSPVRVGQGRVISNDRFQETVGASRVVSEAATRVVSSGESRVV